MRAFHTALSLILLVLLLASCSSPLVKANQTTVKSSNKAIPKQLYGRWVGRINNEFLFVKITQHGIDFRSAIDGKMLTAHGQYNGVEATRSRRTEKHIIHITDSDDSSGTSPIAQFFTSSSASIFIKNYRSRTQHEMELFYNSANTRQQKIAMYRPLPLSRGAYSVHRPHPGNLNFLYRDASFNKKAPIDKLLDQKAKMLDNQVTSLKQNGFNCINETQFWVSPTRPAHLFTENGISSRFLIVSQINHYGLQYQVHNHNSAPVGTPGSQTVYPMINISSKGFNRGVSIYLYLDPFGNPYIKDSSPPAQIPVTIYQFSNTWGDYGAGCRYGDPSSYKQFVTLGKLSIAILFEMARNDAERKEEYERQFSSEVLRDMTIESILEDTFPQADKHTIDFMKDHISTLLNNDFDPIKIFETHTRAEYIKKLELHKEMKGYAEEFVDLLLNLK